MATATNNKKSLPALEELLELVESIENDDGKIPGWLWKRIQAAVKKVRKK